MFAALPQPHFIIFNLLLLFLNFGIKPSYLFYQIFMFSYATSFYYLLILLYILLFIIKFIFLF